MEWEVTENGTGEEISDPLDEAVDVASGRATSNLSPLSITCTAIQVPRRRKKTSTNDCPKELAFLTQHSAFYCTACMCSRFYSRFTERN